MKRRKRLTKDKASRAQRSRLACESLEKREMLTCSSVEIEKYLWDVNGDPDTHVEIHAGDELIYSFEVTNDGCDKLSDISVSDPLPGLVFDTQVAVPYTALSQPAEIPADGNLGPFASVDRELSSDPFEAKAWDNFSLSEWTVIDGLKWTGAYIEPFATGDGVAIPDTDFTIEIFNDDGGAPGTLAHSFFVKGGKAGVSDANVTSTLLGYTAEDGGPAYEYQAMLPFTGLVAGDYWISVTAEQTFPNAAPTIDPTWQWQLGSGPGDGFYTFDDTFDTPGDNDNGDVDETARPASFEADKDLSFDLLASRLEDFNGMLLPGESVMYMGTYIVTDADVAAGKVVNTATVTGSNTEGKTVADADTEVVHIEMTSLELDKYLWDINGLPDLHHNVKPGDELIYAFDVTNNGKNKLTNVELTALAAGNRHGPGRARALLGLQSDARMFREMETWAHLLQWIVNWRVIRKKPRPGTISPLSGYTVIEGIEWTGAYIEPFATGPDAGTPETDFLVEIFLDDAGKPRSGPQLLLAGRRSGRR